MQNLTKRQQKFAELIALSDVTTTDAYRTAYNIGPDSKATGKSITERASRLSRNSKIMATVDALQAETRERTSWSRERYVLELSSLADASRKAGQFSASSSALQAIGRCLGFNAPIEHVATVSVEHSLASLTVSQLQSLVDASDRLNTIEISETVTVLDTNNK